MTGIAFCREPPPALARSKLMRWELGGSDRRGQDKARKVRAVGRGEEVSNFKYAPNIAKIQRTLSFSTMRYCRSTFDTL
jgi:hypothetical protein